MKRVVLLVLVVGCCLAGASRARAEFPGFEEALIDGHAAEKAVYAVALADVDGDERDDIVAVTENRVLWYENPDWDGTGQCLHRSARH